MDSPTARPATGSTLSFRAVVIGVAAMTLMAMWVHFHVVMLSSPDILAESSPPATV
ncbi:MAG: hypothetical protein BWZ02_01599 [Lentisphaerae bacterium ADurb.BinA184]|nr:MAG: hypothetical protein BWZ02_01599 [Lentisphaerae bacterium ADurb.BinA184]